MGCQRRLRQGCWRANPVWPTEYLCDHQFNVVRRHLPWRPSCRFPLFFHRQRDAGDKTQVDIVVVFHHLDQTRPAVLPMGWVGQDVQAGDEAAKVDSFSVEITLVSEFDDSPTPLQLFEGRPHGRTNWIFSISSSMTVFWASASRLAWTFFLEDIKTASPLGSSRYNHSMEMSRKQSGPMKQKRVAEAYAEIFRGIFWRHEFARRNETVAKDSAELAKTLGIEESRFEIFIHDGYPLTDDLIDLVSKPDREVASKALKMFLETHKVLPVTLNSISKEKFLPKEFG